MSAPPEVRLADAQDTVAIPALMADAFVDEPALAYWLRQGDAKRRALKLFFEACVGDTLHPQRQLWVTGPPGAPLGAAIWLGPGQKPFELPPLQFIKTAPRLLAIAGIAGGLRGLDLGEALGKLHPSAPHDYLAFLGVAPAAQGQGVGSTLLNQGLRLTDERGLAAALETSTPRNVALYQRYGFEITGEVERPGLRTWCMTRPAQG